MTGFCRFIAQATLIFGLLGLPGMVQASGPGEPVDKRSGEFGAPEKPEAPPPAVEETPTAEGAAFEEPADSLEEVEVPPKSLLRTLIPRVDLNLALSYSYDINDPNPPGGQVNASEGLYAGFVGDGPKFDLLQLKLSNRHGFFGYSLKGDFGNLSRLIGNSGNLTRGLYFTNTGGDWETVLQEAYAYAEAGPVVFTVGRFPSPIGYEVVEPWANPNITRSRAWIEQPMSLDGATLSASAFDVNALIGVTNSYFRDDEFNQFRDINGFGNSRGINGKDVNIPNKTGVVFKVDTEIWETLISVAGQWGKSNEARERLGSLIASTDATDRFILNGVVARTFGPFSIAGEWNYVTVEKSDAVVYLLPSNTEDYGSLEPFPATLQPRGESTVINGALYVGLRVFEKGSINLRGDYGTYEDYYRGDRKTDQWSITTTLGWRFSENIAFRVEYRHDGADAGKTLPPFVKDDGFTDSADIVLAQLLLYVNPL